ncbi:hypothetical protein HDU67_005652, partial [Dinochytrium kinnereticum]
PGDVVLGLPSSGPHSNGYSLVRKVVSVSGVAFTDPCPWDSTKTLGTALLTPTKIYVKEILPVLKSTDAVKALCHITGGGFTDNIPRCLPKDLGVDVDASAWKLPEVFGWMKKIGGIADEELARTFNCGIGMVLVVAEENVDTVVEAIVKEGGARAVKMGVVTRPEAGAEKVRVLNAKSAWA